MPLSVSGLFICNVAARNQQCRQKVLSNVSVIFPGHIVITLPEDINKVLVGFPRHAALNSYVNTLKGKNPQCAPSTVDEEKLGLSGLLTSELVRNNITYITEEVHKSTSGCLNHEHIKQTWMRLLHCTTTTD